MHVATTTVRAFVFFFNIPEQFFLASGRFLQWEPIQTISFDSMGTSRIRQSIACSKQSRTAAITRARMCAGCMEANMARIKLQKSACVVSVGRGEPSSCRYYINVRTFIDHRSLCFFPIYSVESVLSMVW